VATVTGVFRSRERAEHATVELRQTGLRNINLLMPGDTASQVSAVPTTETEQPGMGKAVGGVLGGALGMAAGMELGAAAATILIPGVGPVLAVGLAAAAILGVGGAVGGAAAGAALEKDSTIGLPADELFVYKDALKQGRSVILVEAGDDDEAAKANAILTTAGAESIDAAREEWWIGLRSAEKEHYHGVGGDFDSAEKDYRMGFEAACRHGSDGSKAGADLVASEAYRHGYERGTAYRQQDRER
jgi:hypothetical protein